MDRGVSGRCRSMRILSSESALPETMATFWKIRKDGLRSKWPHGESAHNKRHGNMETFYDRLYVLR